MLSLRTFFSGPRQTLGVMALALFALALFTITACSKKIATKEGAAELKAELEESMERFANLYPPSVYFPGLAYEGDVSVTPKGDHYAVTLPHMSIKILQEDESELGYMDLGVMTYKATPAGPDQWRETWEWPTPLTGYDADGAERVKIIIGEQSSTGIWNARHDYFTDLDITYGDINLIFFGEENQATIDIGSSQTTIKLEEQSTDTYSGPISSVLEDVRFSIPNPLHGQPVTGRIARIEMSGSTVNMDMNKYNDYLTQMATISQMDPAEQEDPAALQTFLNELGSYITNIADASTSKLSLEGIEITMDNPGAPGTPLKLMMDKISFGTAMDGLRNDVMNMSFDFGVAGINPSPAQPGTEAFLPFTMQFNFATENLPHKELGKILSGYAMTSIDPQQAPSAPEDPAQPPADPVEELTNAGTIVRMDGTHMIAGDIEASLTGETRASPTAVMKAVSDMRLVLKGVDKAMVALSQPETPPAIMQQGMMMLGMLQSMGKAEVGEDGSNVLVYHLELTEDGSTLLNGEPMPVPGMGSPAMREQPVLQDDAPQTEAPMPLP